MVVAIQPHSDDIPLFAAGTVFKLMDEGAKGYLIRVTNDDMAGPGLYAETVSANARDMMAISKVLGVERTFDLNYNNHMMDNIARSELRARFIFLFRLLKADIVVTYDPWGGYEENPDHYVTSACVEAAAWMAGGAKDYPEHFAAGLSPYSVKEKYYFARFQQRVNRVVDIAPWVERKIDLNLENKAQGPAGRTASVYAHVWMHRASACRSLARTTRPRIATTFGSSSCSRIGSLASATGSPMPNGSTTSVLRRITWRNTFERTPSRGSQSTL